LSDAQQEHAWLHRFALLTAVVTFPLLFVGGLVTSTGSGLAVPDWPTTFGRNMFLYPLSGMVGGILYEHSHRLLGATVGFLTVLLCLWLWLKEARLWLRWLGTVALAVVILQGVLGGLRVVLLQYQLAIVHACLAQAFFALVVSIALFTSAGWKASIAGRSLTDGGRLRRLNLLTTGLIYLQIIFGAVLRHTGMRLDAHLFFAALVVIHVILLTVRIWRHHEDEADFVRPSMLLSGLLLAQLGLGLGAYVAKYTAMAALFAPFDRVALTTIHVAVGALMLATAVILTLRAYRLPTAPQPITARKLFPEQVTP
jgi:cytochrome c oxidase assembly protein subunit 15